MIVGCMPGNAFPKKGDLFPALALKLSSRLITADEKLARSVAAHLPAQWLGAL